MSSKNGQSGSTSYDLTLYEKKTLSEARSYAKSCGNKIAEAKQNFAAKGRFGLWCDAKGFFNSSDVSDVMPHMERYQKIYEEIDNFSARVEKGDLKSYDRLLDIYKDLEEMERDAESDVKTNRSKAVCQMLQEFLGKKYKLDHNLKKVECVVLKQKMHDVENTCKSAKDAVNQMSGKMNELINENRAVRLESDAKLGELIEENRGIREVIAIMMREKEEQASEAEKRSEAIRRESEEKLKQAVEEANRRSEARMQAMAEQNSANLQQMMRLLESVNLK